MNFREEKILNLNDWTTMRFVYTTALLFSVFSMQCQAIDPQETPTSAKTLPGMKTFTVTKRNITEWSEYPGVVGSRNYVDVIAQVMGRINAVHVQVGQPVKKGDLLVELDSPGGVISVNSPQNGFSVC